MIVVGAGGFAKELIDQLVTKNQFTHENLYFFDEIDHSRQAIYGFEILHSIDEIKHIFSKVSKEFCLGLGTPKARYKLCKKFEDLGGVLKSVVSSNAGIGNFDVQIGDGVCIMSNALISNGVILGKGSLINANVLVGHDVTIGDFCDIAPGAKISGNCQIGNYVSIGTGAIILPKIKIGDNSFIGAGSVVSNNIPENSMVVGILPSRVVNKLPDFEI